MQLLFAKLTLRGNNCACKIDMLDDNDIVYSKSDIVQYLDSSKYNEIKRSLASHCRTLKFTYAIVDAPAMMFMQGKEKTMQRHLVKLVKKNDWLTAEFTVVASWDVAAAPSLSEIGIWLGEPARLSSRIKNYTLQQARIFDK